MSEDRKRDRVRTILGAHVIFNNKNSTVDCQIRNISSSGARLSISDAVSLPEEFDLDVPQKGRVYRARLCWRDATGAGIAFLPDAGAAAPTDSAASLRELEAENARLKLQILELNRKLEAMTGAAPAASAERAA